MRNPKAIVAFAHDTVVAAVSVGAALYLRLGDAMFALDPATILTMTLCFVAIAGVTFHCFGMYRGVWRYASTVDLLNIATAVTAAIIIFLLLIFTLNRLDVVPRSVPTPGRTRW